MFKENQDCNQDKCQKRTVGHGYESGSWGWGVPGLATFPRRAIPARKNLYPSSTDPCS